MTNVVRSVNWNRPDDEYSLAFWNQNISQFWTDDEIPLSDDIGSWISLSDAERDTYKRVLGGLTMLDTLQGGVGMPEILGHVDGLQRKAVLTFMAMMEQVHAKSYSSIFTTVASTEEIDAVFAWAEENIHLQFKGRVIQDYYTDIDNDFSLYMAMVSSVLLESALFYSGFFYPILLAGRGQMMSSGEIIDLIMRDEAVHGQYVGTLAREIYENLSQSDQALADRHTNRLVEMLYENEAEYTRELYDGIGLTEEALAFVRYNFNRAAMNLGRDTWFPEEPINPIVLNGMSTATKFHDFFSRKGNGYERSLNIVPLSDADFDLSGV